ncbi:hypothetical protein GH714_014146 [Hevea brasiliensis]|uniref:Uncharacterized protein n=1 Tax=Hevea brasiliensis TaxID=3981 RepID=A0A6A6KDV4_HEVBR|nr:hypothetical protein GH714_014146 [Hevea brasiliensis]
MTGEGGLPSLSPGHMSSSPASFPATPDASIGSAPSSYPSNWIMIRVVGGKSFLFRFIPNGHTISTHIMGTFREQQDATGYTWKDLSPSTRDFYWQEFMDQMKVMEAATTDATSNSQDDDS